MIFFIIIAVGIAVFVYSQKQVQEQTCCVCNGVTPVCQCTGQVLGCGMKNIISPSDIAQFAANAGFSGYDLTQAVAIALAESGGDANNYNPETKAGTPQGKGSYGLWQIYLKAHPEFEGVNLYDPQNNANAAFGVYQNAHSTFRPWSTFTNLAYQKFLDTADTAVAQLSCGGGAICT